MALSAALCIWILDVPKTPHPVWMRRGLAQAHARIGALMPASLEQPVCPLGTHVAHCLAPRERWSLPGIIQSIARRPPLIPVERPLVPHREERTPFIRYGTAVTEHTRDVAEIADAAGKRVVVEVVGIVIAFIDRNDAHGHGRIAVTDIRVCAQCIHEILDVLPDGYGILILQFGDRRVTRSHIDCGEADKFQE